MEVWNDWFWFVVVVVGLLLILLELMIGVQVGLDFVILGSVCIIAGLATWPFHQWLATLAVATVVCVTYIVLGRRYVHRWSLKDASRTNVDSVIGREGTVLRPIGKNTDGLVKVGNEEWRARSEEGIAEGETIVVVEIKGVTLSVKKRKEGSR